MITSLDQFIQRLTFWHIFILAIVFRLLAVLFSGGYGFSDDHFEVIEIANALHTGQYPWAPGEVNLFNLIYIFIHIGIIQGCERLGINDPLVQAGAFRAFHALVSLLSVWVAFQWVKDKLGQSYAMYAALLMAVFWIFPFMSVRSLREFICVPFILAAFYLLDKNTLKDETNRIILAGFCFGLAFVFRMQTVFFPLGAGLYLLFTHRWKVLIVLALSTLVFVFCSQGVFDWWYWGSPLASLQAYVEYNATHSNQFSTMPWWHYIGTVAGLGLPTISFLALVAWFGGRKTFPLAFWGALCFIVFHSIFPNKQERFILPFFPFFILLSFPSLGNWLSSGNFWLKNLTKVSVYIFMIINTLFLFVLTFTFTKNSRVEAMHWFYKHPDANQVLVASGVNIPFPPVFYAGRQLQMVQMDGGRSPKDVIKELKKLKVQPRYVLITSQNESEKVLKKLGYLIPNRTLVKRASFEPSFVDDIAYRLNPKNNINETWVVYEIK